MKQFQRQILDGVTLVLFVGGVRTFNRIYGLVRRV